MDLFPTKAAKLDFEEISVTLSGGPNHNFWRPLTQTVSHQQETVSDTVDTVLSHRQTCARASTRAVRISRPARVATCLARLLPIVQNRRVEAGQTAAKPTVSQLCGAKAVS